MPAVYNGIGTWYWGRKNIHVNTGVCEFCSGFGELHSYDTTLYFVVVFLPIIPLGKKRVLDECQACKQHRVLSLKEWEEKKKQELTASFNAFKENSQNLEAAQKLLRTAIGYQDEKIFMVAAEGIKDIFANSAETQALLAVGYVFFGHKQEAELAYRASLALNNDPAIREAFAVILLKQFRVDDAKPLLQHIFDQKLKDRTGHVYLLVEAYQAKGMHGEASDILVLWEQNFPELGKDKEFKKYKKISKNRNSQKKVKAKHLLEAKHASEWQGALAAKLGWFIGPVIISLILGGYFYAAYSQGKAQTVYVVNGLDHPYLADIAGNKVKLAPHTHRSIQVPEGDLAVKVTGQSIKIPDQKVQLSTPFWSRPFLSRTFVINPDRVALIVWEETEYTSGPQTEKEFPYKVHVGKPFYEFKGIDYAFQEFPGTIRIKDKTVKKERIFQLKKLSSTDAVTVLSKEVTDGEVKNFIKDNLSWDPSNDIFLYYLSSSFFKPDESIAILKPRLKERPPLIEWHRAYQNIMQGNHPEYDLVGEYRGYLDQQKENGNGDFLYLLGRIVDDDAEAEKLYLQSIEGSAPCPYGFFSLSYYHLANGRFEKALDFATQVSKIDPKKLLFKRQLEDALLANQKFDDLLKLNHDLQKENPKDGELVAGEIRLLMWKGAPDQAQQAASKYCQGFAKEELTMRDQWRNYFDAIISYGEGNEQAYFDKINGLEAENFRFETAFHQEKWEEMSKLLKETVFPKTNLYLLGYLLAKKKGKEDIASQYLNEAVGELSKGRKEEQIIAECFAGKRVPDVEKICSLTLFPYDKKVFLTVMGEKFPEHKARYYEMARKLNYDRNFPHLFLKKILAE